MKKVIKTTVSLLLSSLMVLSAVGCSKTDNTTKNVEGKTKLVFQIWDIFQKPGMEAMAAAYNAKNPNVEIEVQVTNWDEYWTKLEAAATSGGLPDVFWMHTNEFMKYATAGQLADLTNLYDDVSKTYYNDNFPNGLVSNVTIDDKIYGVPKDWDTIGLVYNKEIFDAAGVSYPDETWDWNTMTEAAQKIFDTTKKYGFLAPLDDQAGYWNTVYQAGGFILNEDRTKSGFNDEATKKGIKYYTGLQLDHNFSPAQTYFAENEVQSSFFSEQAGMFFAGSWSMKPWLDNYPDMVGKWDVAVLPKCPDPIKGDGRATIYNGLSYATGANGKNSDVAKDFIKFLGTEEAMNIQGNAGSAIPAFNGTEQTWLKLFADYDINVKVFLDMMEYGVRGVNSKSRAEWKPKVNDKFLEVYSKTTDLDKALEELQKMVDDYLAKE